MKKALVVISLFFLMLSVLGCNKGPMLTQNDLKIAAIEGILADTNDLNILFSEGHICGHILEKEGNYQETLNMVSNIKEIKRWVHTAKEYVQLLRYEKNWSIDSALSYIEYKYLSPIDDGESSCPFVILILIDMELKTPTVSRGWLEEEQQKIDALSKKDEQKQ